MLSTCAQHFFNTNWNFYYTENHTFFFVKSAVTYLTRFLSQFWTDFQTFFRKSRLIHSSRYVRNRFNQFNVDKFLDSNLIFKQPLQNTCFWTHTFFTIFQHLTKGKRNSFETMLALYPVGNWHYFRAVYGTMEDGTKKVPSPEKVLLFPFSL